MVYRLAELGWWPGRALRLPGRAVRGARARPGRGLRGASVVGGCLAPQRDAWPAVNADRHRARDSDALAPAVRRAVVEDRVVLGGAVVPDREVSLAPLPAHRVLRPGGVLLQDPDEITRGLRGEADHAAREAAEHHGTP